MIGIVGKANVGKSTFFKALTLADVEIANYPFATIKPNHGVGFVRTPCADKFFGRQCNPREGYCIDHIRFVPVDVIDVAGLVPGAHEGKGMGNQFLDDLRQADALIHVIDASGSTNEKGESIQPLQYDPAEDVKFLEVELDMWYLGILNKGWEKFARTIQQEHGHVQKALAKQLSGLGVDEEMIKSSVRLLDLDPEKPALWSADQLKSLAVRLRKLTKPMIIACNKIDIRGAYDNYERLRKGFPDFIFVPCSAESELALKEARKRNMIDYLPGSGSYMVKGGLNEAQMKALDFIKVNVLDRYHTTGVQDALDKAVFGLLKYLPIFPGGLNKLEDQYGNTLPDCFLMPDKSTALDFAYRLHSDFGDNFIRAIDVKTKRAVGRDHVLKSGDVIEIISGK
ncbi:redox-regulated ATPase YchF [Candidatus Woesearchaeota archaeon]|nr:redox-regulated ATPase YchF [Candidatus Woesearchaeota archaeon]